MGWIITMVVIVTFINFTMLFSHLMSSEWFNAVLDCVFALWGSKIILDHFRPKEKTEAKG